MEEQTPNSESPPEIKTKGKETDKKTVGQLFGIQLSAPQGMKNPMRTFLILVVGNFLLLFLLGKALGLF